MNYSLDANVRPLAERQDGVALDMLFVVLVYVLLEDKSFRIQNPCVGTLLRPELVLTTRTCLELTIHGAIDTEFIVIYVRNSQVLRTAKVFLHPNGANNPDVALILSETALVKDFPILPAKEFKINNFKFCNLCGFGEGQKNLRLENFKAMKINKSEMETCGIFRGQGGEKLCLHFQKVMPCHGDVGAPLVCDGALHAIFSPPIAIWAAPKCLDTYGATFTPVHPLVPWIRGVNSSLEATVLSLLIKPWSLVLTALISLAAIVAIYYGLMRYVEWTFEKSQEANRNGPYSTQQEETGV